MGVEYKDYYKILGVTKEATEKEIKSAYRKLARTYHPDVNPSAEAKFKNINEAYEVLGDAEKRKRYDSLGSAWSDGSQFNPPPGVDFGGMGGGFGNGGFHFSQSAQDLGGFSDFFDMLFGAGFQQQAGFGQQAYHQAPHMQTPAESLDLESPFQLTLQELYHPGKKNIRINGQSLSITVPKGSKPGTKIKLKGQGRQGRGRQGDLYLVIACIPEQPFDIEGRNITYALQLAISELVLGTTARVPLFGEQVTVKIPPGIEPGKKLRVKGKGLTGKSPHENGDLFVEIHVNLPKTLTDEQKKLFEALKQTGM